MKSMALALAALTCAAIPAAGGELTLDLTAETRVFASDPPHAGPGKLAGSFSFEAEYYHEWTRRNEQFVVTPFARLDAEDGRRTHADIRELYWRKRISDWEVNVGIRKIFWGVTESVHLVDIVNQTDLVENIDGEDKLGQPMLQATWVTSSGTLDVFWLPFFRERTFPSRNGRLRPSLAINTDKAEFESRSEQWHQDWAFRWFHTLGAADIGISYFRGTDRQPRFMPTTNSNGDPDLIPRYDQTSRFGLDLLMVTGSWLWKLETVSQEIRGRRSTAFVGGFEYTLVGAFGSRYDLGLLSEYLYDDRGRSATPFEHDLFLGGRLALNDISGSSILAGVIVDTDSGSAVALIEAGTRLTDWWSLEAELRAFANQKRGELLYDLRDDSYLQLSLTRHL